MTLDQLLVLSTCLALAASGLAFVAQALVPKRWESRKPFTCGTCMAFWGTLITAGVAFFMKGLHAGVPFAFPIALGGASLFLHLSGAFHARFDPFQAQGGEPQEPPV